MERVRFLERKVSELERELARYRNPKNSRNSLFPPSKDENRFKRTKASVRIPIANPAVSRSDLSAFPAELFSRRQVLDLPIISPVCTENRSYSKSCPCGEKTKAAFLAGINVSVHPDSY
ncbi:hypothetical protein [Pararhodonellum marinum]|uniref:hypothetical protein n=1 Tax=Pararhodonellum marinum TaxID=2755358 RepID=UPI0018906AE1|nr:hypothetical protein [Pararhodonellum marinum]